MVFLDRVLFSLPSRENKHPSNFETSVFAPPLAENRPTPALSHLSLAPCFRQLREERKPFPRRHETFVFLSFLPNTRHLPFQRLFSIPFAVAASHRAKACACFSLLFSAAKALPLSPAVVLSPTASSSALDLGSGYCAILMVSFLERIFCTTVRISFFSTRKRQRLSNSLSISSISLRTFLSFSRYSLVNCFIISSQNTSARHPEAPRITTHEASSRVWRALASIFGISTSSHEGFSTPFFFATSTRCTLWVEGTLQGLVHPGVSGTALGLLPGLYLLSSSRDWRKCRFIALYGRDPCQEDWATLEPKVCDNPLCCSFPICVFVHSISCWFGNYPLHFA